MGNKTFDQNQNLLDLFNDNMYFIDTLTSKYRSYPNYDDIKQVAYLTAWESLLRYDGTTKTTTWIQANVAPALKGYAIKENYNGIVKHNNRDAMKIIGIIGKGKKEGKTEQEIWKTVKDEGVNIDADSWRWIWENGKIKYRDIINKTIIKKWYVKFILHTTNCFILLYFC